MDDGKRGNPTNGETDGDDADIYGKALAATMMEQVTLARVTADRLKAVVHTAAMLS